MIDNETTPNPSQVFNRKKHHKRTNYGFHHGAVAHTEQQAIEDHKMTFVK